MLPISPGILKKMLFILRIKSESYFYTLYKSGFRVGRNRGVEVRFSCFFTFYVCKKVTLLFIRSIKSETHA